MTSHALQLAQERPDFLQQLYPHARDADCFMQEATHTYYVHGTAYKRSVSGVWKVFFEEFDSATADRCMQKAQEGLRDQTASVYWLYMYLAVRKRLEPGSPEFWQAADSALLGARIFYKTGGLEARWTPETLHAKLQALLASGAGKPKTGSCYFLAACAGCSVAELRELWNFNGNLESLKGTLLHKQAELYMQAMGQWQLQRARNRVPVREILRELDAAGAATLSLAMLEVAPHTAVELWDHPMTQRYFATALPGPSPEFRRFEAWVRAHDDLSPYRSEWSIYDEDAEVAGQVDSLWFTEQGSVVMADWKRARELLSGDLQRQRALSHNRFGLSHCRFAPDEPGPCRHLHDCAYNHYLVQQHLYADLLRRKYDVDVCHMSLVQAHPDVGATDNDFNEATLQLQPELAGAVMRAFLAGWCKLL